MPDKVEVLRSDTLYLVHRGDVGMLVDVDSGKIMPRGSVESILAHCNAYDPWESSPLRKWPGIVREAANRLMEDQE